jgi:elongation factor P
MRRAENPPLFDAERPAVPLQGEAREAAVARISTNQFRNGITIVHEGHMYDMIEHQFVKPGKGSAFVRTRLKNIRTGKVLEYTFDSKAVVDQVSIEKKEMECLYREGDHFVFMDQKSFDQVPIEEKYVEPILDLLKENTVCAFKYADGELISVLLPDFVVLEVTEADPYIKGSTATGGPKPAKVETGATVNVPVFVERGSKIKIDTRTYEYVERM